MPDCKRCGFCCQNFSMPPAHQITDRQTAQAVLGFLGFPLINYVEKPKVFMGIIIKDSPCNYYDPETKSCRIYETRPDFCRNFYCEKCYGKTEEPHSDD